MKHYENINIDSNAVLKINKRIYSIIQKLHLEYPGREWSGLFSWNVIEGGFSNMKEINKLVIEVDGIYPLAVGSSGSVYYELTSDVMQLFVKNKINPIDKKFGTIHTHHTMGAFFSNVDDDDLFDSSKGYINYISLVVDTKNTYKAVISKNIVKVNKEYKVTFKNSLTDSSKDSSLIIKNPIKNVLLKINLNVEIEDLEYPDYIDSFITNIDNNLDATKFQQESFNGNYNSFNKPKAFTKAIENFEITNNYDIIARELYCKIFNMELTTFKTNFEYKDIALNVSYIERAENTGIINITEILKLIKKYKFKIDKVKAYFSNSNGPLGKSIYATLTNNKY